MSECSQTSLINDAPPLLNVPSYETAHPSTSARCIIFCNPSQIPLNITRKASFSKNLLLLPKLYYNYYYNYDIIIYSRYEIIRTRIFFFFIINRV